MTRQSASHAWRSRIGRVTAFIGLAALACGWHSSAAIAQGSADGAASRRLTIPYLANATKPADLDFAAAECDIASNGEQMACRFRQVFLTTASFDPTMCVITTNGYDRTFRRTAAARWVSEDAPAGNCGLVETIILEDGGGTRWTMTIRTAATLKGDQAECRAAPPEPEIYDWRTLKRKLPCTSIQPGAIER